MTDATGLIELGMVNDLRQIEIISHNLANINTTGFKRDMPISRAFAPLLESASNTAAQILSPGENTLVPNVETLIDLDQGVLRHTGNALDIAIEGQGLFEISTPQGVGYSRRGDFVLDASGRLVTHDGHIVNGVNGEIRLLTATPRIDAQGMVWDEDELIGQLKLVQIDERTQLQRMGPGLYYSDSPVEQHESTESLSVRQGFLEASNVEVMDEMVRMISTVRHFEMSQRVIKGYDEVLGEAISTIAEF